MTETPAAPQAQIARLLDSNTLRSSESLRRLLAYLADKAFRGEAEQLKEYTIGVDAFGKPPTYDPRRDAIVRLQIGRLRQKLEIYYRTEGKDDPITIDLPKGHYKLIWASRPVEPAQVRPPEPPNRNGLWRTAAFILAGALLISLAWGTYATLRSQRTEAQPTVVWTPELERLWRPFIATDRPLIIGISDPLFVGLQGTGAMFRTRSLNSWQDVTNSPDVATLRKMFGNAKLTASFTYTGLGEANSSFLLGKLLGSRKADITLARSSQVSWQDSSNNNVVLIGPPRVLNEDPLGMPLETEFVQDAAGIRNLHPRPGEQPVFSDTLPDEIMSNGDVFALVSHATGPLGKTSVLSFTSNRTWGRLGAIRGYTDPAFARLLVQKMTKPSGEFPRAYQVVLKVEFRDGVPTNVSYVLHHELAARERAASMPQ